MRSPGTYSGKGTGLGPKSPGSDVSHTQAHKDDGCSCLSVCADRSYALTGQALRGGGGGLWTCWMLHSFWQCMCVFFSESVPVYLCLATTHICWAKADVVLCVHCSVETTRLLNPFSPASAGVIDADGHFKVVVFYPVTSQPSQTMHIFIGLKCSTSSVPLLRATLHGKLIFWED